MVGGKATGGLGGGVSDKRIDRVASTGDVRSEAGGQGRMWWVGGVGC